MANSAATPHDTSLLAQNDQAAAELSDQCVISPYLMRPLRTVAEVLADRRSDPRSYKIALLRGKKPANDMDSAVP